METDTFVSIDVETANQRRDSICQIGCCLFGPTGMLDTWQTLVNPELPFADINTRIHEIDAAMVSKSPTFLQVLDGLNCIVGQRIIVSYSAFDLQCFEATLNRYNIKVKT